MSSCHKRQDRRASGNSIPYPSPRVVGSRQHSGPGAACRYRFKKLDWHQQVWLVPRWAWPWRLAVFAVELLRFAGKTREVPKNTSQFKRQLKVIASYVTREWHARAFETLEEVHTTRPRPRLTRLLQTLLPGARKSGGFHPRSPDEVVERHHKQDTALARAVTSTEGLDDFSESESEVITAIEALLQPRDVSEGALWDAVYAAPARDDLRLVLADALTARGDPRGEFIVLQLTAQKSKAMRGRESRLLKQFGQIWLSKLQFELDFPVFRRGFVSEAKHVGTSHDFDAPEWATLEVLELGSFSANRALLSPNLRHLKKASGVSGDILVRAADQGMRLAVEHLGGRQPWDGFFDPSRIRSVLPHIRRVDAFWAHELGDDTVARLFGAGILTVGCNAELPWLREGVSALRGASPENGASSRALLNLGGGELAITQHSRSRQRRRV